MGPLELTRIEDMAAFIRQTIVLILVGEDDLDPSMSRFSIHILDETHRSRHRVQSQGMIQFPNDWLDKQGQR